MSEETIDYYFASIVSQEFDEVLPFEVYEIPTGMCLIQLVFSKLFGSVQIDGTADITSIELIAARQLTIPHSSYLLSSERDMYTKELEDILAEMHIPEDEQPLIIEKIFQAVEVAESPGLPIVGLMADCTLLILGDIEERAEFTPATKSSIDCLEKVRLDSLEASIKKMQCVICKEGLDHYDNGNAEEGINDSHQPAITRLPCLHLYHTACIVQWLENCHVCPLCRYPLPSMQEEVVREPLKPSGRCRWWLHLPFVLTLSAGGILTAMVLYRILNAEC